MASRNIIEYKRIVARRVLKDMVKKKKKKSNTLLVFLNMDHQVTIHSVLPFDIA